MTLREIFSSIGNFFGKLFNFLLDTDIFIMIGFVVMIISPPFLIYTLVKTKKIGAFFFSIFIFFIWAFFVMKAIEVYF